MKTYEDRLRYGENKDVLNSRIDALNREAVQLQSLNPKDVENDILRQKQQWEDIVSQTKKYFEQSKAAKAAEAERQKNVVTGLQVGEKPMTPQRLGKLNAAERKKIIDPLLEESKKLGEEQRRLMLEGVYNPESTKRWDELRIRQAQINKELEKYKK